MSKVLIKPKYVVDEKGKKESVVLSLEDYEDLLEQLEDLEAGLALDNAADEATKFINLDEVEKRLRKKGII